MSALTVIRAPRRPLSSTTALIPSAAIAVLALLLVISAPRSGWAQEIEQVEPDSRAVEVINVLLEALAMESEDARSRALVPILHDVMLARGGVHPNFLRILGRKARVIDSYVRPADVARVDRVHATESRPHRFGNLRLAVVDRYYLEKTSGNPDFVTIVWTENDGPKVVAFP